jgi:integrase
MHTYGYRCTQIPTRLRFDARGYCSRRPLRCRCNESLEPEARRAALSLGPTRISSSKWAAIFTHASRSPTPDMLKHHPSRRSRRGSRGASTPARSPWEVQVAEFIDHKRSSDEVGEPWLARMRWELNRFPLLLSRVGRKPVLRSPRDVTGDCIQTLRDALPWETPTFAIHFQALRQFLRWGGNPVAGERSHWRLPTGTPVHRRWLARDQLIRLYLASRGVERVIVALEGLAGLRRVEVLRLRVKDVMLNEGCLRILGKGRGGGKWRTIPLQGKVERLLRSWIRTQRAEDRVVPLSRSGADAALQRAVRRSGLAKSGVRVSHHDLRRTFGRLANASGMSLLSLQGLFGHTSPALSAHYVGLDFDELRGALARLGSYIDSEPVPKAYTITRHRRAA